MSDQRIYELDAAVATNTQGKGIMIDKDGDDEATFLELQYHVVTTLPESPTVEWVYYLNVNVDNYPKGVYKYDGLGWICQTQLAEIALSNWTGSVTEVLISGVVYNVTVTGVTNIDNVSLNTNGVVSIIISNSSEYAIANPSSGYKTGEYGLDELSSASTRLSIQLDVAGYEYTATSRVLLT